MKKESKESRSYRQMLNSCDDLHAEESGASSLAASTQAGIVPVLKQRRLFTGEPRDISPCLARFNPRTCLDVGCNFPTIPSS